MLNLVKMNLLKMIRMKCVYVMFLLCIGIGTVLVIDSQDTSMDAIEEEMREEKQQQGGELSEIGVTFATAPEADTVLLLATECASSGMLAIMVGIFVALLACSERECGFLKNLASCSQHKWQIVIARLVPAFLFFIVLQVGLLSSLIVTNCVIGSPLELGSITAAISVLGIQLLLHTAFAALVLMVAEITRSQLLCVIFSMFVGLGLISFLISFLIPAAANFLLISRCRMTALPLDVSSLPLTIIIGVIAVAGYGILGSLIFQKRDVY